MLDCLVTGYWSTQITLDRVVIVVLDRIIKMMAVFFVPCFVFDDKRNGTGRQMVSGLVTQPKKIDDR